VDDNTVDELAVLPATVEAVLPMDDTKPSTQPATKSAFQERLWVSAGPVLERRALAGAYSLLAELQHTPHEVDPGRGVVDSQKGDDHGHQHDNGGPARLVP
jgi:hypothetical protein